MTGGPERWAQTARRANHRLPVQPPCTKYSAFFFTQIIGITSAVPLPGRGVGHRHERWSGMRWTRQRRARFRIAGRFSVSDFERADERRCFPASPGISAAVHTPPRLPGEDGSRTAKPCGPGTRCWCQVGGDFAGPTGLRQIVNPPATVTRRIRRRGDRGISR